MIRNPKIGDMIREMAHSRSELTPNNQQGDMIAAELNPSSQTYLDQEE